MISFPFVNWKNGVAKQCIAACIGCMSMWLVGEGFSWISGQMLRVEKHVGADHVGWLVFTSQVVEVIVFLPFLKLSSLIGRRSVLQLAAILNIFSYGVVQFNSLTSMYIARCAQGLTNGAVLLCLPVYLNEICVDSIHGAMGHIMQVMWYLGVVYSYATGPYVSATVFSFTSLVPPLVFAVLVSLVPESPRWYVSRGKELKALESLSWLRGGLDSARREYDQGMEGSSWADWAELREYPRAVCLVTLLCLLHAPAAPAVLAYSAYSVYRLTPDRDLAYGLQLALAALCFVASSLAMVFHEKCDRRPTLITSSILSFFTTLIPAVILALMSYDYIRATWIYPIVIFFILMYPLISSLTYHPLINILTVEMFEPPLQKKVFIYTTVLNSFLICISSKIFPILMEFPGDFCNYAILSGISLISLIIIYFFLPETKESHLFDIKNILRR